MNAVFSMMMIAGILAAAGCGEAATVQTALLTGGEEAVSLCLSLAGAYAFFGGLLGVMRESGITTALAVKLRKPIMYLFAFEPGEERALSDICVNLSADMLGMGGAALPAGLSAMRTMAQAAEKAEPSRAMLLFLVMNMCSVQLLPTTMIALRAQAGARNPSDIMGPVLAVTAVSNLTGIAICKFCERRSKKHG